MLTGLVIYFSPVLSTLKITWVHFPSYSVQLQDKFWQFATSEWQKADIEATTENINDLATQVATMYVANLGWRVCCWLMDIQAGHSGKISIQASHQQWYFPKKAKALMFYFSLLMLHMWQQAMANTRNLCVWSRWSLSLGGIASNIGRGELSSKLALFDRSAKGLLIG